jgi:hypothetical protein
VRYRLAEQGEIPDGRTVDVKDRPGGQAEILLDPGNSGPRLPVGITLLCSHQIVHGLWRQRWTHDDRMRGPAQGLRVAVSRWERIPGHKLPAGLAVYGVEEDGSCIWLVDEDECSMQLQNDMNDMLLRLAGDGLWIQVWLKHHRAAIAAGPALFPPFTAAPTLA